MKNLFLILLLVIPLTVNARDINVCANWTAYPEPSDAIQLKVDYWVNGGNAARLGTVGSFKTQVCSIVALELGNEVCGHIWAQFTAADGTKTISDKSPSACVVFMPALLTPEGLIFNVNTATAAP